MKASEPERIYTPKELAEEWRLSEDTIRRTFQDRHGVMKFGKPMRRGRRGYVTLRIPESVVREVRSELSE